MRFLFFFLYFQRPIFFIYNSVVCDKTKNKATVQGIVEAAKFRRNSVGYEFSHPAKIRKVAKFSRLASRPAKINT